MLKKSLIAKTCPFARKENVLFWDKYRVTVLQDGLFRLEYSKNKKFRDEATQSVWFRNVEPQTYSFIEEEGKGIIATARCRLILSKARKDCRVELGGKLLKIDNAQNLKGTYRTLDCFDGDIRYMRCWEGIWEGERMQLENGVCSRTGVAVFDDSASLTLAADGEVKGERADGSDEYIFAYGNDYRAAVQALYLITGATPLIPKFALGNWWSRYHAYTDEEYLRLLNVFEERNIPLTVATIDMDWHYSMGLNEEFGIEEKGRNTPFYGGCDGWTGYTWNKHLFPDHEAFLAEVAKKNLTVTLNVHPADGVRWWESEYAEMAEAMGIDPQTGERILFDVCDTKYVNAYFDILHRPHERAGVAFWWIDWQQGTNTKMEGLDPLWSLNHYHYLHSAEVTSQPMILSRYSGVGSHRYPLGFSGDTFITWKTLKYLPYFTLTATNVGYTWWSHDIGGHMMGTQSNELYLRSVQYGVFSPINRLHSSNAVTMTKEPWAYGNGAGEIAANFLRLRHALIPFLYTQSYRTHTEGRALIEPLYYEWDTPEAYAYKEEYLFGGLLVAPVVTPLSRDGYARVKAWIPEGKWTDIFTGDCYVAPKGGRKVTLYRTLDSIPALAKAGSILPLSMDGGNNTENPSRLQINVYEGNGEFTLFEDGRREGSVESATTHFKAEHGFEQEKGVQRLHIQTAGEKSVLPKERKLRVLFKDIPEGKVTVYKDGVKMQTQTLLTDCMGVEFTLDYDREYTVEGRYQVRDEREKCIERARRVLLSAEGDNMAKMHLYNKLCTTKSAEEYLAAVEESTLAKIVKLRLTETL